MPAASVMRKKSRMSLHYDVLVSQWVTSANCGFCCGGDGGDWLEWGSWRALGCRGRPCLLVLHEQVPGLVFLLSK